MNNGTGILGAYMRGVEKGKQDAKANKDWADLSGCCPYFKDGYAKGYRS